MHSIHAEKFDGYRPVGARLLWEEEVRYCLLLCACRTRLGWVQVPGTQGLFCLTQLAQCRHPFLFFHLPRTSFLFFYLFRLGAQFDKCCCDQILYHLPGPTSGYFAAPAARDPAGDPQVRLEVLMCSFLRRAPGAKTRQAEVKDRAMQRTMQA